METQTTTTAGAQEARVFHTLDALRGIAAIGVVVFHMAQAFAPLASSGGYLAVDLFFMMSGVVLSNAYEARFRAGMGTVDFMRLRLIRLYPLYLLGLLFGIAVTVASFKGGNIQNWDPSSIAQAALLALLFLPDLSGRPVNQIFPLNVPCWSLFFELLVNLLFVACWRLLTSRVLIVLCLLSGGVVGWAILRTGHIDQGSIPADFAVGLARTVFGFFMGVLIARHIAGARRGVSNLAVLVIVVLVAIAIAGAPSGQWRPAWDALCVLVVFPLLVWWGTLVDPGPRLRGVATFLGVTSYAVYVLHSPLASVVNSVSRHFSGASGAVAGAPFTGIAVLILLLTGCWLVDRLYDMPVRRWLGRVIPRMQGRRRSTNAQ